MQESGSAMTGRSILVVEDEPSVAFELMHALEDNGATPVGPFPSVRAALDGLAGMSSVDGAILDLNLDGEIAFPVAEALARRQVPFIFATGYDIGIPEAFLKVPKIRKPYDADRVVLRLARSLDAEQRPLDAEILALLPALRALASVYVESREIDPVVSDALVDAILIGGERSPGGPLDGWLLGLLRRRLRRDDAAPAGASNRPPDPSRERDGTFLQLPRDLREALLLKSLLGSHGRVARVLGRTVEETERLIGAAERAHGGALPPFTDPRPPRTDRDG